MDLFSWHLTALKFQSWQWEVWKRKLTLDECSFSWVLQAIYIHVDIFHYTVLSLKMNLVLCSQIFYKKCIDDDWPLCRTYIRKLAISDPNSVKLHFSSHPKLDLAFAKIFLLLLNKMSELY